MRVGTGVCALLIVPAACSLTDLEQYQSPGSDAAIDASGKDGSFGGSAGWPAGGSSGSGGSAGDAAGSDASDAKVSDASGGSPPIDASCAPGFADCDQTPINGCETELGTNADCSTCDDVCSAPIGTTACVGGACKVTACPAHRGDCDGLAGNGCEADLKTTATCGSCTTVCPENFHCAQGGDPNLYVCACGNDANCLNGGTCYFGAVCICGGVACELGQRCTLISTCF